MWHNSYAICELSGFLTNKSVISNIKCQFCFFVYKYLHKFAIEVSENLAQHTVRRVLIMWAASSLTPGIMRSGANQSS